MPTFQQITDARLKAKRIRDCAVEFQRDWKRPKQDNIHQLQLEESTSTTGKERRAVSSGRAA